MTELHTSRRLGPRSALVAGLVLALGARASATPKIDLTHCPAFDELALRRAIIHELPVTPTRDFTVVIVCPDLVTATAYIDPTPGDGPLARELNLGEVPNDLRIKLFALVIAELVEVAAGSAPPIFVPEKPIPRGPPVTSHVKPVPKPDPKPGAGSGAVAELEPGGSDGDDKRDGGAIVVVPPAMPSHNVLSISPRIGTRVYPATPRPLVDVSAELAYARFRLGLDGAVGQRSETLGTLRPYVATATLAREIVCGHSLCALVRIAGGVAGVSAEATAGATAHPANAAYGEAELGGEWSHKFDGWAAIAAIDVGWAEGMIARANGVDAVQLAGLRIAGSLGARWQ